MRFTTFYFSGTGNTKWAADEFDRAVRENGDESQLISIEDHSENLITTVQESDMIGIAFPVYAMNVPRIMKRFIARLNMALIAQGERKPLYVLITAGYADGCGPYEAARQFSPGTVRLKGYAGVPISTNICTPPKNPAPLPVEKIEKRLNAASRKINALADALSAGKRKIPSGPYSIVLFRKKMNRFNVDAYKRLSVNPETCSGCGACITNCPSGAIKKEGDAIKITSGCTACFRCYNNCPTASIWYDGMYADPSIYPRYTGPASVI